MRRKDRNYDIQLSGNGSVHISSLDHRSDSSQTDRDRGKGVSLLFLHQYPCRYHNLCGDCHTDLPAVRTSHKCSPSLLCLISSCFCCHPEEEKSKYDRNKRTDSSVASIYHNAFTRYLLWRKVLCTSRKYLRSLFLSVRSSLYVPAKAFLRLEGNA